jgi:predicted NBD/HSP70 family sugar kinase
MVAPEPGTPRLLRAINDRAVLDLLLTNGALSRPALGELTGLSKPTMSQILARLQASALVRPSGSSSGRPGPNAALYEVNPSAAFVAGLDVTPRRIRAGVADITGRTVGAYELATPGREARDTVARVVKAVDGAAGEAGVARPDLDRLMVATPGAFDPRDQRLRYARHLPGWHDPEILPQLEAALGIPVDVDNDVNLAAVAEQTVGAAHGVDNFVLLWGEEGIGAAVVIDGRLHRGATGGAGEVGFLPLPGTPLVRKVGINNAGGFQELAGGKAVLALARAHSLRASTAENAVRAAARTPGRGDEMLADLGHRLAVGLAAIVAVLDPDIVILGGGVFGAGGDRLRSEVVAELHDLAVSPPRVELTAVKDDPVLRGALQSALRTTRERVFNTSDGTGGAVRAPGG